MHTALLLEQAGPWGQAFPEPLFEGHFKVNAQRRIGHDQRHIKCLLQQQDGIEVDAVAFNQSDEDWPENCHTVTVTYRISVNRFRGSETLQLMVQDVLYTECAA